MSTLHVTFHNTGRVRERLERMKGDGTLERIAQEVAERVRAYLAGEYDALAEAERIAAEAWAKGNSQ